MFRRESLVWYKGSVMIKSKNILPRLRRSSSFIYLIEAGSDSFKSKLKNGERRCIGHYKKHPYCRGAIGPDPGVRGRGCGDPPASSPSPPATKATTRATNVEGSRRVFARSRPPGSRPWSTPPRSAPTPRAQGRAGRGVLADRRNRELRLLPPQGGGRTPARRDRARRPRASRRAAASGLIFKAEAASEIRRLFLGPLVPGSLVQRRLIPVVPRTRGWSSRRSTAATSARPTDWPPSPARRRGPSTSPPSR